jgi:hypothetical protein
MATQPTDFLSGLGGLANLPNPFQETNQVTQAVQQQQGNDQSLQLGRMKIAALQQQDTQRQQYQTDVQDAIKTGNFAGLYAKYPEQADALKQAHDALDEPARQSQERDLYQISSFLKNGAIDPAKKLLQGRIDADKRNGSDTTDDQRMLDALESGDPQQVKAAADMALYAILPADKRGEVFKQKGGDTHVITAGGALVDDTGHELYRAPLEGKTITVKNADGSESVVSIPGTGGSVAAGGSSGALSTRLNNPGAIRFDPNNQWQGQTGQQNGFAVFDTPENGARAHRKLISNQIAAGYDTPLKWAQHYAPASDGNDPQAYAARVAAGLGIGINDKIPSSAVPKIAAISAAVEAGGTPAPSGAQAPSGAKILFTSKGTKPSDIMSDDEVNFYADRVAGGADLPPLGMGKDAAALRQRILGKAAQIAIDKGINGGQANLIHADLKANTRSLGDLTKLRTFVESAERTASLNADQVLRTAPAGVGGSAPIFNRWIQAGRKNVSGDPALSRFSLAVDTLANEYAKVMTTNTGTGGTTSDSARAEAHALLSKADTLQQLQATIHQMRIDMNNRRTALITQDHILRGNISAGCLIPQRHPTFRLTWRLS